MSTSVPSLAPSLETLKNLIQDTIDRNEQLSARMVKEFVEQAAVKEEDLRPYADFDHPIEDCYGRKMIHDGGKFEIMAMSWNPGDYSSIHNHGYTQWGVVQVFGNVQHFIYQVKDGIIDFAKKEILTKGSCAQVVNTMIHRMGNATTSPYMTLHIYGCNERDKLVTADAKNYELEHDRVNHTTGGAFLNLPENQIYDFEPGPKPTDEVFINYAKLLLEYYHRQEQTAEIKEKKKALLEKLRDLV